MKICKGVFYLKSLVLPVIICVLSTGCLGIFKRNNSEIAIKDDKIYELEEEKNRLLQETETLRNKEDAGTSKIKSIVDESLRSTGINVKVKADGGVSLVLQSSACFASGESSLKQEIKSTLKKISVLLNQQFYNNTIRIEGHTDDQPIRSKKNRYKTNWELSAARAISVLDYFIDKCGVNPEKIYIAGFGEYDPIASNSTKTGREQNRRVEIVIIP